MIHRECTCTSGSFYWHESGCAALAPAPSCSCECHHSHHVKHIAPCCYPSAEREDDRG